MEIEIVKQEKDNVEIRVDNTTVAEVLRVYLNEQGVELAVWRKDHPTKPAIFKIQTSSGKTVKKVVGDAITAINKDCDKILAALKKE